MGDDTDPMVSVMKVDKAPTESYADIGGLESQIQEIKEAVELPLAHPELYEEVRVRAANAVHALSRQHRCMLGERERERGGCL